MGWDHSDNVAIFDLFCFEYKYIVFVIELYCYNSFSAFLFAWKHILSLKLNQRDIHFDFEIKSFL